MKLYTEEQVKKVMSETMYALDANRIIKYIDENVTPIELPTDEEIVDKSKQEPDNSDIETAARIGYVAGAKWMRDKIINQNK